MAACYYSKNLLYFVTFCYVDNCVYLKLGLCDVERRKEKIKETRYFEAAYKTLVSLVREYLSVSGMGKECNIS